MSLYKIPFIKIILKNIMLNQALNKTGQQDIVKSSTSIVKSLSYSSAMYLRHITIS